MCRGDVECVILSLCVVLVTLGTVVVTLSSGVLLTIVSVMDCTVYDVVSITSVSGGVDTS